MIMQFSGKELAAILKMGIAMANADGVVKEKETEMLMMELARFGVPKNQLPGLFAVAESMEPAEAILTISALDDERKKYVSAYLATIMVIDNDINDNELKLWKLTCTLCGCPSMNIRQALEYMANF